MGTMTHDSGDFSFSSCWIKRGLMHIVGPGHLNVHASDLRRSGPASQAEHPLQQRQFLLNCSVGGALGTYEQEIFSGLLGRDRSGEIISEERAELVFNPTFCVFDRVPAIDSIVGQEIVGEDLKRDLPRRRLAEQAVANLLEPVAQHLLGDRLQGGPAAR
jgi:hypothetical protein